MNFLTSVTRVAGASLCCLVGCDGVAPPVIDRPDRSEGTITAETVLDQAAAALCDALLRCCPDDDDVAAFFSGVANAEDDGIYADLKARVPPNAPLDAASCPALVGEIHQRKGIGPFAAAASDGLVSFAADAAGDCLATLDEAACGADVAAALYDSTCFGLQPPAGGDEQRTMFVRTTVEGACRSLADGFGALFFGSCDPASAFCCILDEGGGCGFPAADSPGICQPAGLEGERCSGFNPVLPCVSGLECIPGAGPDDTDACVAPSTTPLSSGDRCYDGNQFRLLGVCSEGYCDLLQTDVCLPAIGLGEPCTGGGQCGDAACIAGVCAVDDTCSG